jgi:G3E family GTPase
MLRLRTSTSIPTISSSSSSSSAAAAAAAARRTMMLILPNVYWMIVVVGTVCIVGHLFPPMEIITTNHNNNNYNPIFVVSAFSTTAASSTVVVPSRRLYYATSRPTSTSSTRTRTTSTTTTPHHHSTLPATSKSDVNDEMDVDQATTTTSRSSSSSSSTATVIPITILSGFLGSGKTTLLTHMLQNKEGLKIGIVVNDVASVNIDSKLLVGGAQQPQPQSDRTNRIGQSGGTVDDDDDDFDNKNIESSSSIVNSLPRPDGMVELQNGCACCSLSDELLTSVSQLVTMSDMRDPKERFNHIVVELSGVADPKQVRANFQEAVLAGMPLMDRVKLDTLITVVDGSMFESYFTSTLTASRKDTPELFGTSPNGVVQETEYGDDDDDWMKDMPPQLLEAVMSHLNGGPPMDENNGVAELLVSQVETADVVILNKCDLLRERRSGPAPGKMETENDETDDEIERLKNIICALNPRAAVQQATYGKVPLLSILAVAMGEGVAASGMVDDHRDYVDAALASTATTTAVVVVEEEAGGVVTADETLTGIATNKESSTSHSHSHSHSVSLNEVDHDDDDLVMEMTDDENSQKRHHAHNYATADDDHSSCTDESHSHSHPRNDAVVVAEMKSTKKTIVSVDSAIAGTGTDIDTDGCTDVTCTDPSHSHSHSHAHASSSVANDYDHDASVACADATCTDPTHSHSHTHSHSDSTASSSGHAGIGTYVYRSRRPFHPGRLVTFLKELPVIRGIPDEMMDMEEYEQHKQKVIAKVTGDVGSTLKSTLRSKGFIWCADSHTSAMYWSQAGASFELACLGQWWATLPRNQWPQGIDEYVLQDFDDSTHTDDDNDDTPTATTTTTVGDRRQEIVFIGPQFDTKMKQQHIQQTLDECLLTPAEYKEYQSMKNDEEQLQRRFANVLESKYVNF